MNEEENNAQEQIVPRPEGYTIARSAPGWEAFIFCVGMIIFGFIMLVFDAFEGCIINAIRSFFEERDWLFDALLLIYFVIIWIIACKITEVKVNLKINDEGLEQIRLSGSKFFPEYRMIKWEDMKAFNFGEGRKGVVFHIRVKYDMNFNISLPIKLLLFERYKRYDADFDAFRIAFEEIAAKHDVYRVFFC